VSFAGMQFLVSNYRESSPTSELMTTIVVMVAA
jgi:hypothetical protein